MTLKLYQKKRNFNKTPEPKGHVVKRKQKKLLYIIQKHAASHLHYDFRLELNGVLLSWAVPKGPSLDPSVKRLAMHVEDHPISYGSFEGTIPKGQYGGGTVMLWDKGEWICEDPDPIKAYKKGNLTFQLKAKKLNGRWKLIRMHNDDKTWLLMKLKDDFSKSSKSYDITVAEPNSVISNKSLNEISSFEKISLPKSPFPTGIYPELATLVDKPPGGKNWLHEIKFDGYRFIIYKQGKTVKIITRNQNDWTSKFKDIAQTIKKLPVSNIIFDGEIVVLNEDQHSDFQLLQNSLKNKDKAFIYYAFDLLYLDQYDLRNLPLIERKKILENFLKNNINFILRYSDHVIGSGEKIFTKSCRLGLEGIVSKKCDSIYTETRDKNWLKIKCTNRQEFVIAGFNPSQKTKYFRSLILGTFNENHKLIYHGNVGTGFTQDSLKNTYNLLLKYKTNICPFEKFPSESRNAVWIEPKLIAEVEFGEWTKDKILRHSSFKGLRMDKPAKTVVQEKKQSVKQITHPDKILYPERGITKQDIYDYYETISDWILPYVVNRPLTLVRCPDTYKKCFFQKHLNHANDNLHEITITEKKGTEEYVYIKNQKGLFALTQLSVLEIHLWNSKIKKLEYPDQIIFDIDPDVGMPWKKVVEAAFAVKTVLDEYHLASFVKSTGGKGLHVVIPIKPEYKWDDTLNFAKTLVEYLVQNNPKKYTGTMSKTKRKNKIFLDYLRNHRGATAISPYSIRARKNVTVATPLAWEELTHNIRDTTFTIETIVKRLQTLKKDPWRDFLNIKQSLKLNKL